MVSDWEKVTLVDHCQKIGSGATPRGGSSVYLEEGEIALIRSQNIYNEGFSKDGLVYITVDAAEKLKNVIVEEDDILLNITGDSVARVCMVDNSYLPARVNQHVSIIRPKAESFNAKFLRYYLTSPYMQQLMLNYSSAGATRKALTKSMIENLEVLKPSLEIQSNIAHILGTLDDKIELNRQMNETLEAMAQALFKSWFVDFDPVIDNALLAGKAIPEPLKERAELRQAQLDSGKANTNSEINDLFPSEFEFTEELGWIPKGWSVSTFGNESEFSNGYAFKSKELSSEEHDSYHVFKMGHIKRGGGFNPDGTKSYYPKVNASNLEKYLLKKGDILMAMTDMKSSMALLGHTALMPVNNKYLLNQRVGRLRVSNDSALNYPYIYIYSNLQTTIEEIRSRSNSGVQVNLSTSEIKATPILVPSREAHDLFDKVAVHFFNKIFSNDDSSDSLAKLRDTLLPKLMSGELRIADAEKLVADIG